MLQTNTPIPTTYKPTAIQLAAIEKARQNYGYADFPLVHYNPATRGFYSSLTVFDNIRKGHARIFTYDLKLKSIFSLKCHFHSNSKKFTYRSDTYPGDIKTQWKRMLDLANRNKALCFSMQLYDNRRAAPDDLLLKWDSAGEVIFSHQYLPFATPELSNAEKDQVIYYYNSIKNKFYETLPGKVQI